MSEMVERVAKAMAAEDALGATADGPQIDRASYIAYLGMARAAIAAMREPTREMHEAVRRAQFDDVEYEGGELVDWQIMIDEALK